MCVCKFFLCHFINSIKKLIIFVPYSQSRLREKNVLSRSRLKSWLRWNTVAMSSVNLWTPYNVGIKSKTSLFYIYKSPDFGDSGSVYCYKSLKEYIFNKLFVDLSRVASGVIASHGEEEGGGWPWPSIQRVQIRRREKLLPHFVIHFDI